MIQINNGFKEYYYLLEDGTIYNQMNEKIIKPDKRHLFMLTTEYNKRKRISLKRLYQQIYNKCYCVDLIKDLSGEIWQEIPDTNGAYYISNKGRVKSYTGYNAAVLKPYKNKSGYDRIDISYNNHSKTVLVHRLVAAAFLPVQENITMQLHHKDFNKSNNAADNLEWLLPSDHKKKHIERKDK